MSVRRRFRLLALATALCTGVAGLPACAPDGGGGRAGPTATCAELAEQYGSFQAGTTVTVATSFRTPGQREFHGRRRWWGWL